MSKVGEAYFDIVGREGPLLGSLDRSERAAEVATRSIGRKLDRIGEHMTTLGTRWSVAVTAPITGLSYWFSKAASDAEETHAKFDAVFKGETASARQWAEERGEALRRNATDLESYMARFQDIFVPMGFARGEAAELSRQLTQLTLDLASFNNEAEPEVARSLSGALVGNHENARRFGVVITENTLLQKAFQMGLATTREELTEQEKVLARLQILMEGTTDAQGDAERTAESHANTMRALNSATAELAETWGERLNPRIDRFVNELAIPLADALTEVDDATKDVTLSAAGMAAAVGPGLLALGWGARGARASMSGLQMIWNAIAAHPLGAAVTAAAAAFGGMTLKTHLLNQEAERLEANLGGVSEELLRIVEGRGTEAVGRTLDHVIAARRREIQELEATIRHPASELWLETAREADFRPEELRGMLDQAAKFRPGLKEQLDAVYRIIVLETQLAGLEERRAQIREQAAEAEKERQESALATAADVINAEMRLYREMDEAITRDMLDRYGKERDEIERTFTERAAQIDRETALYRRLLEWRDQRLREIDQREAEDARREAEAERAREEARMRKEEMIGERRRSLLEEVHAQYLEAEEGELTARIYRIDRERDARMRMIQELFGESMLGQQLADEAWEISHRMKMEAIRDEAEAAREGERMQWMEISPEKWHTLIRRQMAEEHLQVQGGALESEISGHGNIERLIAAVERQTVLIEERLGVWT